MKPHGAGGLCDDPPDFPPQNAAASLKHIDRAGVVESLADFPPQNAAASLKREARPGVAWQGSAFSAAERGGLIEAPHPRPTANVSPAIFRRRTRRPH